ncbi:SMP-30/gluconolactonase/LRE family protein [Henriciella mobilis]|uniref:SMP-30/gluconolactonase/LRE family protein n=1 Tax=Henriciella mobilis TaxID=2305467 RepID=UPI001F3B0F6F|nr:SMP-30/gluconolactonase/LRE family protein [Henriciella mobilis]
MSDEGATVTLDVFDDGLRDTVDPGAKLIKRAEGFTWSEGPAWDPVRARLYFSDVPQNKAWMWSEAGGKELFLDPSGAAEAEGFREPGSNGLLYANDGSLLVCNHGLRRVERLNIETRERSVVADQFDGKPFNSPNDVIEASDGTIYFTDPPYGLAGMNDSPLKALTFNGVYRLRPGGTVELLLDDMTFPNGVALSPDQTRLYVSQSDPAAPILRELSFDGDGAIASDRILFDAAPFAEDGSPGLPDGMAVDAAGRIFLTGPGGIFVVAPQGQVLGRIRMPKATANCAFGGDGSRLFITSSDVLYELPTKTMGI